MILHGKAILGRGQPGKQGSKQFPLVKNMRQKYLGAVSLRLLGCKFAPKLVHVLKNELLSLNETIPWEILMPKIPCWGSHGTVDAVWLILHLGHDSHKIHFISPGCPDPKCSAPVPNHGLKHSFHFHSFTTLFLQGYEPEGNCVNSLSFIVQYHMYSITHIVSHIWYQKYSITCTVSYI